MMKKILISSALVGSLFALASPVSAASFSFTSDGIVLTFDLPDSPTPIFSVAGEGFVLPAAGTLNGDPWVSGYTTFLNTSYDLNPGISGGFSYDGSVVNVFSGPQLYSGSEFAPVFLAGTYSLTQYGTGVAGTLVISDVAPPSVPEPMTWAMMLGGFGLVGGAMRRRITAVTYA